MRISDWSSDVCSSDLLRQHAADAEHDDRTDQRIDAVADQHLGQPLFHALHEIAFDRRVGLALRNADTDAVERLRQRRVVHKPRSEEHTSELQSLMRISYAVFCLKKKKLNTNKPTQDHISSIRKATNANKIIHIH